MTSNIEKFVKSAGFNPANIITIGFDLDGDDYPIINVSVEKDGVIYLLSPPHRTADPIRCRCGSSELERENYLNRCSAAGCDLQTGKHRNCGSQHRTYCIKCGATVYDTADDDE